MLPWSVCCAESSLLAAPCKSQCFLSFFFYIFFFFFYLVIYFSPPRVFGGNVWEQRYAQPSPARVCSFFLLHPRIVAYFSTSRVRYFHITACSVIYRLILLLLSETTWWDIKSMVSNSRPVIKEGFYSSWQHSAELPCQRHLSHLRPPTSSCKHKCHAPGWEQAAA